MRENHLDPISLLNKIKTGRIHCRISGIRFSAVRFF